MLAGIIVSMLLDVKCSPQICFHLLSTILGGQIPPPFFLYIFFYIHRQCRHKVYSKEGVGRELWKEVLGWSHRIFSSQYVLYITPPKKKPPKNPTIY